MPKCEVEYVVKINVQGFWIWNLNLNCSAPGNSNWLGHGRQRATVLQCSRQRGVRVSRGSARSNQRSRVDRPRTVRRVSVPSAGCWLRFQIPSHRLSAGHHHSGRCQWRTTDVSATDLLIYCRGEPASKHSGMYTWGAASDVVQMRTTPRRHVVWLLSVNKTRV